LKFGILFSRSPEVGRNTHLAYEEWVDFGVEAERLGYSSFWTTQYRFASERDCRPFGVAESESPTLVRAIARNPVINGATIRINDAMRLPAGWRTSSLGVCGEGAP
jgi:hypothetical protein